MKDQELNDPYFYLTDAEVEEMREPEQPDDIEKLIDKALISCENGDCQSLLNSIINLSLQPGVNEHDLRGFLYHILQFSE